MRPEPEALLLTGAFGVGKSTLAADVADVLETAGITYAALDLDWLTWTNAAGPTRADEHEMMLINLASIMSNYRDARATHFVLARSIKDRSELATLVSVLGIPLFTVELVLPYDEIERRLATDPTAGRREDLARSAEWIAGSTGSGLADLCISADQPVRELSNRLIGLLGWVEPATGRTQKPGV